MPSVLLSRVLGTLLCQCQPTTSCAVVPVYVSLLQQYRSCSNRCYCCAASPPFKVARTSVVRVFFLSFLCFSFISFQFISFFVLSPPLFFSPLFPVYVYTYHGYVPGVISLQVIRDGIPQLAIVPFPLRAGTAVHVYLVLFSSIETLFVACFIATGKI